MAQIDGAGQQDTDNQNAEALQAALAQRQVTLQGQPKAAVTSLLMRTPIRSQTNRKFYAPVSLLPENVVYRGRLQRSGLPQLLEPLNQRLDRVLMRRSSDIEWSVFLAHDRDQHAGRERPERRVGRQLVAGDQGRDAVDDGW